MSIEKVKHIFESLQTCKAWLLLLLQIKNSKRNGTVYNSREIIFSPEGALSSFAEEIASRYTSDSKKSIDNFDDIREYDGSTIDNVIYKLSKDNLFISTEYEDFMKAVAAPDTELDPLKFNAQAYVLQGRIKLGEEDDEPIKLISMQNPLTTLKHKFLKAEGTFTEITDKVLSLRTSIDVIIFQGTVYMLTLAGERLFNLERAYKAVCAEKLDVIEKCDIVTDYEAFSSVAGSGHNPRKFVSFNDNHLEKLKDGSSRKKIASKFNIAMDGDKFDTSKPDTADKLVKLLCDRGMVDPFDENPMEVAGSKKWE